LGSNMPYRVIAVDDGSLDRTGEILKDLSSDYPVEILVHQTNLGLGAALRTGLMQAAEESFDDDVVITMDSDNTHDPKEVLNLVSATRRADVVIGSRYVTGGVQINVPAHRVVMSRVINALVSRVYGLSLKDNTSGFRCFKACLVKKVCGKFGKHLIEQSGFVASLELLLKAVNSGGVVSEVPILLDYGKKEGKSKMRLISTVLNYLALLLKRKQV